MTATYETYESIMKDEIMHYSPYYFEFYTRSIEVGKMSFIDHIEKVIKPNREFIESIFFRDVPVMFTHFTTLDQNIVLDEQNTIYNEVLGIIKKDFLMGLKEFYLTGINMIIDNVAEELKFAIEDEHFYISREYINREAEFGKPLSEIERLEMIKVEAEKKEKFTQKLEYLKGIRLEIAQY